MGTPWLSDREQQVWRRFAAVLELLPGVLDSELSQEEGLTHFDYFALAMLSRPPASVAPCGAGGSGSCPARLCWNTPQPRKRRPD